MGTWPCLTASTALETAASGEGSPSSYEAKALAQLLRPSWLVLTERVVAAHPSLD